VIDSTLESVGEARVITQNYDAEYGQAIAGVVIASTTSSTNELHGWVFEYIGNNSPGFQSFARDSFNSAENNGTLPLQNITSSAGRLVERPLRTSCSFSAITRTQRIGGTVLTQVPTLKARQGDFSEYVEPAARQQRHGPDHIRAERAAAAEHGLRPVDGEPATGEGRRAFETDGILNKIPASRLNVFALRLMQQLPEPNARDSGSSLFRRNFAGSASGKDDNNQFNTRWDY
jgi:hypothetical protein